MEELRPLGERNIFSEAKASPLKKPGRKSAPSWAVSTLALCLLRFSCGRRLRISQETSRGLEMLGSGIFMLRL